MIRRLAVVGLGMVLMAMTMAACGGDDATPKAEDAWARTSAMMQDAGAVYVTITGGDTADRLVKAQAPTEIAAMTEIHETTMNDEGTMMMGQVPAIEVPAGGHRAARAGRLSHHVDEAGGAARIRPEVRRRAHLRDGR